MIFNEQKKYFLVVISTRKILITSYIPLLPSKTMQMQYKSLVDELLTQFPKLREVENTDITDHNLLWHLSDYIKAGHVNFETGRKELYRLSILIENYASKHNVPLLATFETDKRYKYVQDRYIELLEEIPKAWIIGNFNNPYLAPHPPKNAEVISCDGTNLEEIWMVVTQGEKGPFGLVAENIGDGMYRGFFSSSPAIIGKAINSTEKSLRAKIDLTKSYEE